MYVNFVCMQYVISHVTTESLETKRMSPGLVQNVSCVNFLVFSLTSLNPSYLLFVTHVFIPNLGGNHELFLYY